MGGVDRFNYLRGCIWTGGRISDEMFSSTQKARLASISLSDLWRWCGIGLLTERRVYTAAVGLTLLSSSSETWSLRADVQRISVFGHHYLPSIGGIWWDNFLSSSELRRRA